MPHYLIPRKIAFFIAAFIPLFIIANMTGMVRVETLAGAIPVFCPFKVITGIDCPGCGMTRAMASLIDGHPGDAVLYNPFCFFLLFILMLSLMPRSWVARLKVDTGVLPVLYSIVLFLVLAFWFIDRLLPRLN